MNTIAFRLTALVAALFVGVGVLAPTTAHAAEETAFAVTGGVPSSVATPQQVALCTTACISGATATSAYATSTDGTTAGRFALTSVPNGTYKLVVKYSTTGYAAFGYLKSDLRGKYTVTGDFAAATPFVVDGDSEFGSMVMATPAPNTQTPATTKKPKHGFKRLTHRGGKVGWLAEDKVRLTKKGAKKQVFLQIRKGGKWRNAIRQTTTKKGVFYFDAVTRKQHRQFKTKSYKIGKLPKRYAVRVVVPGNKKFARTVSNSWTVSW